MSVRWMGSPRPSFSAYGDTPTAKNLSMMSFNDHPFFFGRRQKLLLLKFEFLLVITFWHCAQGNFSVVCEPEIMLPERGAILGGGSHSLNQD